MPQLWQLWTLEARTRGSRARIGSASSQQVQRDQPPTPTQYWRVSQGSRGGLWLTEGEKILTAETQGKHLYSYILIFLQLVQDFFFFFFSLQLWFVIFIIIISIQAFENFFKKNHTFNFLYFYFGFLQFCDFVCLFVFCSFLVVVIIIYIYRYTLFNFSILFFLFFTMFVSLIRFLCVDTLLWSWFLLCVSVLFLID